jgi:hypothetical protein
MELSNPENFITYALYLWQIQCIGISHGNGKVYGIKFSNVRAFSFLESFQFSSAAFLELFETVNESRRIYGY